MFCITAIRQRRQRREGGRASSERLFSARRYAIHADLIADTCRRNYRDTLRPDKPNRRADTAMAAR